MRRLGVFLGLLAAGGLAGCKAKECVQENGITYNCFQELDPMYSESLMDGGAMMSAALYDTDEDGSPDIATTTIAMVDEKGAPFAQSTAAMIDDDKDGLVDRVLVSDMYVTGAEPEELFVKEVNVRDDPDRPNLIEVLSESGVKKN